MMVSQVGLIIALTFCITPCIINARSLRGTRAVSYIANQTVCVVDGTVYRDGDPIPTDDVCESCKCRPPGFSCVLRECEIKPGCKAIRRENECCPEYQCGCEHNGKFFNDGDRIPNAESPCYSCYCQGSSITCALADCKFRFDCEPEYVLGECCPRYDHCPPEPTTTTSTTTLKSILSTLITSTPTPSSISITEIPVTSPVSNIIVVTSTETPSTTTSPATTTFPSSSTITVITSEDVSPKVEVTTSSTAAPEPLTPSEPSTVASESPVVVSPEKTVEEPESTSLTQVPIQISTNTPFPSTESVPVTTEFVSPIVKEISHVVSTEESTKIVTTIGPISNEPQIEKIIPDVITSHEGKEETMNPENTPSTSTLSSSTLASVTSSPFSAIDSLPEGTSEAPLETVPTTISPSINEVKDDITPSLVPDEVPPKEVDSSSDGLNATEKPKEIVLEESIPHKEPSLESTPLKDVKIPTVEVPSETLKVKEPVEESIIKSPETPSNATTSSEEESEVNLVPGPISTVSPFDDDVAETSTPSLSSTPSTVKESPENGPEVIPKEEFKDEVDPTISPVIPEIPVESETNPTFTSTSKPDEPELPLVSEDYPTTTSPIVDSSSFSAEHRESDLNPSSSAPTPLVDEVYSESFPKTTTQTSLVESPSSSLPSVIVVEKEPSSSTVEDGPSTEDPLVITKHDNNSANPDFKEVDVSVSKTEVSLPDRILEESSTAPPSSVQPSSPKTDSFQEVVVTTSLPWSPSATTLDLDSLSL